MDSGGVNVEPGKIFVGGLSWETTKEGLKQHFEKHGEVEDCVIMMDPITKRPRGFGFVTFKDPSSVNAVMSTPDHILDNKKVDPKPATVKTETPAPAGAQATTKKVFVGGISSNTKDDDVRAYFSQYGKVTDVDLKFDKATQRMRGFGFVGFDSEEIVEEVCRTRFHQLNGKTVEVKKAEPRYATASAAAYQNSMGYGANATASNYGGYGRGAGNYGAYSAYGYHGYSTAQQQQPQQQQQYGYGYGTTTGYGGQSAYGQQFAQGGAYTGAERGYYTGQQTATGGQQQMGYGQDSSAAAYARNAYTTGTEGYSSTAHSNAAYSTYDSQGAAASYPQYADAQTASYGRGGMTQQRAVNSYQQYGNH